MALPLSLDAESEETFAAEVEELCDLLDKSAQRGPVYVRWLVRSLHLDQGGVLLDAAADGGRLLEELGLGAIMKERPFQLPLLMAQLGGAVATFCSTHKQDQPLAVIDVVLRGAVLPALALRSRAREALSPEILGSIDEVLQVCTHVLTHLHRHAARIAERLTVAQKSLMKEATAMLLDVLDDTREDTAVLCTHVTVLILASCDYTLYPDVQVHRNANSFGTQFISLVNRGMFRATGGTGDDTLLDVAFAKHIVTVESTATQQALPSSVIFPRDLAVFCEVLHRDIRDHGPATQRGQAYAGLLRHIAASALEPVGCSVDMSEYQ